jgi:cytochrome c peroxidase
MGRSVRDACEEAAKTVRFFDVNVLAQTLRDLATSAANFAVGPHTGTGAESRTPPDIHERTHLVNAESEFGPRQARRIKFLIAVLAGATLLALAVGGMQTARAKHGAGGGGTALAALNTLPVPAPPDIQRFIKDSTAAKKLGKALFWDMQAGSDGRTACATCHYDAGTDNRSRNQINPRGGSFNFAGKGPNSQLTASDFPLHRLADPNDAASAVTFDTDNVVGSQGVMPSKFDGVDEGNPFDVQTFAGVDPDFHVGSVNVRRSTGRNAPSVINAVFNQRNFWDGRAQNEFNGVNPFGNRDVDARVGHVDASGSVEKVAISIANSSLASQADGPPGNPVEMSSDGRSLSDIGKKLLSVRPLASQQVSASDSLLGGDAAASGQGLKTNYADLIRDAFQAEWWNSGDSVSTANGRSYSLMQFNFPMFWGLAIQAYESTLVSDQAPIDKFLAGDTTALSADAQAGLSIFSGKGSCETCHEGPAFTDATVSEIARKGLSDGASDTGFHNVGVRPTATDPGIAGSDPFGNPLSVTGLNGAVTTGVEGTFKTPTLRNIDLTGPYFHNGGQMTLRQVVDFYSRGGDFANPNKETTALGLTDVEKDQLVAFLEALTDPRVKDQSAPFDHPQLFVPMGEQANADGSIVTDPSGRAVDCFKNVAATGAAGGAPLPQFPAFTGPPCDSAPALEVAAKPAVSTPAPAAPQVVAPSTRTCVVPKLTGHTLGYARKLLAKASCASGFVGRPRGVKTGLRIFRQKPAAGTVKNVGFGVSMRLRQVKHRAAKPKTTAKRRPAKAKRRKH